MLPSTSDNEQQVPKDALDFLGEVVSNGTEAEKADVSQLLAERLREPSISVKLKVLRVVMVLASKGGPGFAGHLRTKALPEMQAHTEFEAPPDPTGMVWAGAASLAALPSFRGAAGSRTPFFTRAEYDEHGPAGVHRKCF